MIMTDEDITELLDQYFRDMVFAKQNPGNNGEDAAENRLMHKLEKICASMPVPQANDFMDRYNEIAHKRFMDFKANPDAELRKIGSSLAALQGAHDIPHPARSPSPAAPRQYRGSGIGRTVVRTAVRATVWEAVFSIFRGLR